ncbi:MAG: DNA translocase FtsK 4TM domain-containing protein [Kiritimatiellae bacterium]|jgi:S-DNA-T family DNA segregation ATPase FtsK/SpoIIIE|nr:DNA translocase FtsK 4TM domain-containing protein [Kiritimatiellia bacterium]
MAVPRIKKRRASKAPEPDRMDLERRIKKRVIGLLLLPLSVFPLLSIVTYNWRDISWLNSPPLNPTSNMIGLVGAWSVFLGYTYVGLALWTVPFFVIMFGILMVTGRLINAARRIVWVLLFIAALACMLQLGSETALKGILLDNNIYPNAGGALGYAVMTKVLTKLISPVGGGILMLCIMIFALFMIVGARNVIAFLGFCSEWVMARQNDEDDYADDKVLPNSAEVKKLHRKEARDAAKEARLAAKKVREEEREKQHLLKKEEAAKKRALKQGQALQRQVEAQQKNHAFEIERIRKQADAARRAAAAPKAQPAFRASPVSVPQSAAAVRQPKASLGVAPAPVAEKKVDKAKVSDAPKPLVDYMLPPIDLLDPIPTDKADHGSVDEMARELVTVLDHFKIPAKIVGIKPGPVVTQYELEPAPHIRVERIAALSNNLKMSLAAVSLRVEAPIPGRKAVGIEIPNKRARSVTFRSIIEGSAWQNNKMQLPLAVGKNVSGDDFIYDLAKAPHMLVAGSTGSGKSVCLNAFLCGLLMSRTPDQVKLILIDPKRVEFVAYNDLPHLLVPVINDPAKVVFGLKWAVSEMDKRYRLLQKMGAKNIVDYNSRQIVHETDLFEGNIEDRSGDPAKLPYIVIVIDEVADIMSVAGKEVEPIISRLCALSRAVGIHMVLATQRPSVNVITGTIKANIPGRIAFKVSQSNDSRVILDSPGAENLIGCGDMLFLQSGADLLRAQGAWVNGGEVNRIVSYVKERYAPIYDKKLSRRLDKIKESDPEDIMKEDEVDEAPVSKAVVQDEKRNDELEQLFIDAIEMIRVHKRVSGELLRRKLKVGYSRANTVLDMLEDRGIVSPIGTGNSREILMDMEQPLPGENTTLEVDSPDQIEMVDQSNVTDELPTKIFES